MFIRKQRLKELVGMFGFPPINPDLVGMGAVAVVALYLGNHP